MWAWHPAEIARLLNVRSAPILLKKSKLAGLRDLRRSKALQIPMRTSPVAFQLVDVVPHIAARQMYERP